MFKKILYPIDIQAGDVCVRSLQKVLEEVRDREARLYLLYVIPGLGMPLVASYFPEGLQDKLRRDAASAMERFVAEQVPDDIKVTAIVREGTPYDVALKEAKRRKVDLIVVPSRDRGKVERWLLGSNASKIVHHADCAVLVLR